MSTIDKDKAQTNPAAVFEKPADVATSKDLQPGEKVKILQEWELDARLQDVAAEEGMARKPVEPGVPGEKKGGKKSLLPEIKKAQRDLGAKPIPDEGAPTKFTP